jgi:hypothetical protein
LTGVDVPDCLFCGVSIVVAAMCNPLKVMRQIWPHVTVLGLFTGFVLWNGGVVLGKLSLRVDGPFVTDLMKETSPIT